VFVGKTFSSLIIGVMLGSCSKDLMSTIQHGAIRQARMLLLICNKGSRKPVQTDGSAEVLAVLTVTIDGKVKCSKS
jgi:hypothetical protein